MAYDMGFRAMEFWRDRPQRSVTTISSGTSATTPTIIPCGQVQQNAATARIAFQHQIIDGSPVFIEDGATHLFVMKFVLSDQADSDTISIYLDPTSVTEPDLPNLAITATNVQLAALGMGQFGGFGPNLNTIDELRIATTFIDALPELPLPGDTDGDRDVDLDDYNNIITNMGLQVGTALAGRRRQGRWHARVRRPRHHRRLPNLEGSLSPHPLRCRHMGRRSRTVESPVNRVGMTLAAMPRSCQLDPEL